MARHRIFFTDDGSHLDRFGLLLVLTALSITILMFVELDAPDRTFWAELGWFAVTVIVGLTLSLALRASGVARRLQRIGDVIIGFTVLLAMIAPVVARLIDDSSVISGRPSIAWAALAVLSPMLVLRRVMKHGVVTAQTLAGALAVFLLTAVAFTYVFTAVSDIAGTDFFGSDEPSTSFMYFSLVTITTLGYGDLHPVSSLARYLSTMEALLGQILLVTVVARLVSLYSAPTDVSSDATKESADS